MVAVAAVGMARGDEESAELAGLRSDPIARYTPAAGRLVRTYSSDADDGGVLGKPVQARYDRVFTLPDDEVAAAFDAALERARAEGWEVGPAEPDLVQTGTKELPTGTASLSISAISDPRVAPEGVEPPALLIGLAHLGRAGS